MHVWKASRNKLVNFNWTPFEDFDPWSACFVYFLWYKQIPFLSQSFAIDFVAKAIGMLAEIAKSSLKCGALHNEVLSYSYGQ